MRFACQSCGKAYNLPEEKIADKSNVKLKCRVCGSIVEVKKQGEVVASILADGENKRGRVSEAPAPLTSMMPDDSDDATHAIAVSDQILSEGASGEDAAAILMGHVKSALGQRGLAPLPPPPPTGFGPPPAVGFGAPSGGFGAPSAGFGAAPGAGLAPSGSSPASFGQGPPAGFAPTPVPPPLSVPDLPRADPFASPAPPLPLSLGASNLGPPPPLPNAELGLPAPSLQNGSGFQSGSYQSGNYQSGNYQSGNYQSGNGPASPFGESALMDEPPMPAVAMAAGGAAALSSGDMASFSGPAPVDVQAPAPGDDTTRKMLAALATGILIGFIIARLFF